MHAYVLLLKLSSSLPVKTGLIILMRTLQFPASQDWFVWRAEGFWCSAAPCLVLTRSSVELVQGNVHSFRSFCSYILEKDITLLTFTEQSIMLEHLVLALADSATACSNFPSCCGTCIFMKPVLLFGGLSASGNVGWLDSILVRPCRYVLHSPWRWTKTLGLEKNWGPLQDRNMRASGHYWETVVWSSVTGPVLGPFIAAKSLSLSQTSSAIIFESR
jgi:hypothetical protein